MPWIAAGAAIIGGYMSNRASAKQAAVARDEAGRYSGTAHQREVTDLRAAGLNPILSGTGGAGASTPSGMVASQPADYAGAVSTALAARKQKAEIGEIKQVTLNKKLEANLHRENIGTAKWNRRTAAHGAFIANNNRYQSDVDVRMRKQNQPGDIDAAKFWSSSAYGLKRRADAGLETARKLIPFTTPGQVSPRKRKSR